MLLLPLLLSCSDKSPDDSALPFDSSTSQPGSDSAAGDSAEGAGPEALPLCSSLPELAPLLEGAETDLESYGGLGVSLGWMDQGELVCVEGLGFKDPERTEAMGPSTLHRIGSITKMMTAAALLQQVERSGVDLNQPLQSWMEGVELDLHPEGAASMTGQHMLTHQGGFYDYLAMEDDASLEEFLSGFFAQNVFLMSPPGRFYNYSNPNFYYAGWAIEQASGQDYSDWMESELWGPLGMTRTTFESEQVYADGDYATATSTNWVTGQGEREVQPDSYDNPWARPAGYAWSSVEELAIFARFLLQGSSEVLDDSLRQAMTQPQVDMQSFLDRQHYGYGVMIAQGYFLGSDWYERDMITHDGAIPGFSASMILDRDHGRGLIWLANADGVYPNYAALESLMLGGDMSPGAAPDYSVDTSRMPDCAGSYLDPWNVGEMEVVWEEDSLRVSMPTLDRYGYTYSETLEPYLTDHYLFTVDGLTLLMSFIRDDEDQVEYARTRYFVLERQPEETGEEEEAGEEEEPSSPPAQLSEQRLRRLFQQPLRAPERLPAGPLRPLPSP